MTENTSTLIASGWNPFQASRERQYSRWDRRREAMPDRSYPIRKMVFNSVQTTFEQHKVFIISAVAIAAGAMILVAYLNKRERQMGFSATKKVVANNFKIGQKLILADGSAAEIVGKFRDGAYILQFTPNGVPGIVSKMHWTDENLDAEAVDADYSNIEFSAPSPSSKWNHMNLIDRQEIASEHNLPKEVARKKWEDLEPDQREKLKDFLKEWWAWKAPKAFESPVVKGKTRQKILDFVEQHPDGVTAEQVKNMLNPNMYSTMGLYENLNTLKEKGYLNKSSDKPALWTPGPNFGTAADYSEIEFSAPDSASPDAALIEFFKSHPEPTAEEWDALIKEYHVDPDYLGKLYVDWKRRRHT